jgi:hypothetical protein
MPRLYGNLKITYNDQLVSYSYLLTQLVISLAVHGKYNGRVILDVPSKVPIFNSAYSFMIRMIRLKVFKQGKAS